MKRKIILITILFLTIGFAAVTTTLVINVNSIIGTNQDDFDVYFSGAILDTEDVSDKAISEDKLNINYTTKDLSKIGDTSILEYEVTNASKNYDANVVVTCTGAGDLVTITQTPQNQIVNATEIETGTVTVTLNKNVIEEQTIEFVCTLNVNAIERAELGSNYVKSSKTYALVGKYVDEAGVAIGNANLVIYDEVPHYVTSDIAGNVYLNDLNPANYEIYYVIDSLENIKEMSKEELELNAVSKASFTTKTEGDIVFANNFKITNDVIVKSSKFCENLVGRTFEYGYKGTEEEFIVPCDGTYKIELWGASGGVIGHGLYPIQSAGGYVAGKIGLEYSRILYVYVGINGQVVSGEVFNSNETSATAGSGGGGATDIRLVNGAWNDFDSLKSRIMIAAGAGGGGWRAVGGQAGGLTGYKSSGYFSAVGVNYMGRGATQTSGGLGGQGLIASNGKFGIGGPQYQAANGGGGYYGGGGGYGVGGTDHGAGGGGSSFISGHLGCDAISESSTENSIIHTGQANHYSGHVFKDTVMIDGNGYNWTTEKGEYVGMPTHDGTATMTGNLGNGYAKITLLSLN